MDLTPSIALLGRPSGDPGVQALLARLNIIRQPQVQIDDYDPEVVVDAQDWLLNRGLGIELGFEARAHLNGEVIDEPAIEPMLLSQIYFYVRHDGVEFLLGAPSFWHRPQR